MNSWRNFSIFILLACATSGLSQQAQKKPFRKWTDLRSSFIEITKIDLNENAITGHFISPPTGHAVVGSKPYAEISTPEDEVFCLIRNGEEAVPSEIAVVRPDRAIILTTSEFVKEWQKNKKAGWQIQYYESDRKIYSLGESVGRIYPGEFEFKTYWGGLRVQAIKISAVVDSGLVAQWKQNGQSKDIKLTTSITTAIRDYDPTGKIKLMSIKDLGDQCTQNWWVATVDSRMRVVTLQRLAMDKPEATCEHITKLTAKK